MKQKNLTKLFAFTSLCLLLGSCEKMSVGDVEDPDNPSSVTGGSNILTVRTRGTEGVGVDNDSEPTKKISYPVYIYAFNNKSKCVDMNVLSSEGNIQFRLPEGTYKICALGLDKEGIYTIPDKNTVTPESIVELNSGCRHGDLMATSANVSLSENESELLTLNMSRKVLRIDNVSITNIPEYVTDVNVTIIPLGENLKVNGEIEGKNGAEVIALKKDTQQKIWQSTESRYCLASNSKATVKVALTYDTGKKQSFSYVSDETLQPNYIFNISGKFVADEIQLEGTIEGVSWEGTKNISFDIKEKDAETIEIPVVGNVYKGYYVVNQEDDGENINYTLMSADQMSGLEFEDNDEQVSLERAISTGLEKLSHDGISMRLPTKDERVYISDNLAEINKNLKELGKTELVANGKGSDGKYTYEVGYYFRRTSNGHLTIYFISDKMALSSDNVEHKYSKNYYLRGFATLSIKK